MMKIPELPEIPTDNLYKFMAISGLVLIVASLIPSYLWYKFSIEEIRLSREREKFKIAARESMVKEHDAIVQEFQKECFSDFLLQVFWDPNQVFEPGSINDGDEIVKSEEFNNYVAFMVENRRRDKEAMKAKYRPFTKIFPVEEPLEGEVVRLEGESLANFCNNVKENAKHVFRNDIAEGFSGLEDKAVISHLAELRSCGKAVLGDDVKSIYERLEKEVARVCLKEIIPDGITFLEYNPIAVNREVYGALRESQIQIMSEGRISEMNRTVYSKLKLEMWILRLFGTTVAFVGFYLWYLKLQRHQDAIVKNKAQQIGSSKDTLQGEAGG